MKNTVQRAKENTVMKVWVHTVYSLSVQMKAVGVLGGMLQTAHQIEL